MTTEIANNNIEPRVVDTTTSSVFRFKFNQDINCILQQFAAVHHGDDLEEFKDSWDTFLETYRTTIDIEMQRLQDLGFTGDVENKMFVSVRYYYCKQYKIGGGGGDEHEMRQDIIQQEHDADARADADADADADDTKRGYMKVDIEVHNAIEAFLTNNDNHSLKPAIGWTRFCEQHGDNFCQKKTFKNRIYNYREKIRKNTVATDEKLTYAKIKEERYDDGFGVGFGVGVTLDD